MARTDDFLACTTDDSKGGAASSAGSRAEKIQRLAALLPQVVWKGNFQQAMAYLERVTEPGGL